MSPILEIQYVHVKNILNISKICQQICIQGKIKKIFAFSKL